MSSIDKVFERIWDKKESEFKLKPKRKKRELANVYTQDSDCESLGEEELNNFGTSSKKSKVNFIKKSIEVVERYRSKGLPTCCKSNCLVNFDVADIENCRKYISPMNSEDKKRYIYSHIEIHDLGSGKMKRKLSYEGVDLCVEAFLIIFGVSRKLIYSIVTTQTKDRDKDKEEVIMSFLKKLADLHDFMPDKHEIHLSYNSHRLVYEKFEEYSQKNEDIYDKNISYSYFNKVWRRKLSYIKARKAIRFSKCGKCVKIKEKIAETNKEDLRSKLKKELFRHIERMTLDRKVYQENKEEATQNKEKCLSIAIDGADFQRYGLPYFAQKDKDSEKGFKNPIRTVGIIIHGHGNIFFTFAANVPSDSNCIIFCLHETIATMKRNYAIERWHFPETLHLQVCIC